MATNTGEKVLLLQHLPTMPCVSGHFTGYDVGGWATAPVGLASRAAAMTGSKQQHYSIVAATGVASTWPRKAAHTERQKEGTNEQSKTRIAYGIYSAKSRGGELKRQSRNTSPTWREH